MATNTTDNNNTNIQVEANDLPVCYQGVIQLAPIDYCILRIRVLDYRSNEPVKNAKVKKLIIKGDYKNPFLDTEFKTNLETNFSRKSEKISGAEKVRNMQQALVNFGFDLGNSGPKENGVDNGFGDLSRAAYNDYWRSRAYGQVAQLQEDETPPDEMMDLIVQEYNSHMCTDDQGFLNIRITRWFLGLSKVSIEVGFWDFPIALEDANSNTDGIETVGVCRSENTIGNGTGFKTIWKGNQSTEWGGNYGWFIANDHGESQFKISLALDIVRTYGFFGENDDYSSSDTSYFEPQSSSDAHFYFFAMQWCQPAWDGIDDPENSSVGSINNDVYIQDEDRIVLNMHLVSNLTDQGGADLNGGKGYGMMEGALTINGSSNTGRYRSDSHKGFDILADIGADLFAIRTGSCTYNTEVIITTTPSYNNGAPYHVTHNKLTLSWKPLATGARCSVGYLHISADSGKLNDDTEKVMVGQVIGKAGRSGNLYWSDTNNPGHVHLNVGSYKNNSAKRYTSRLYEDHVGVVDKYNLALIPTNDLPLALPCKGELGDTNLPAGRESTSGTGTRVSCDFSEKAKECWAAWELKCPKMVGKSNAKTDSQRIRIIQAQLKYLGYYVGDADTHGLDNENGNNMKAAIACYKQNSTSAIFINSELKEIEYTLSSDQTQYPITQSEPREKAFADANDVDDSITSLLLQQLNIEAPLPTLS